MIISQLETVRYFAWQQRL